MPAFLGVFTGAAYHTVSALAGILAPLCGSLAAAVAIVLFTIAVRALLLPLSVRAASGLAAQSRLAPAVQNLRKKHAGQPDKLRRELAALYRAEGTSRFAGCLPVLLQWPFLSVMYLLFRSATVDGASNTLLTKLLFGAPLGSHWLGAAGPLSAHGAVFAGLFLLIATAGFLSARLAARAAVAGPELASRDGHPAGLAAVAKVAPYLTLVVAAFLPLAAGLYLLTSTAWTLAERAWLARAAALPPAEPSAVPGTVRP